MRLTKQQIIIIFVGLIAIVGIFFLFKSLVGGKQGAPPVSITVWGTDPPSFIDSVTRYYAAYRPNVTVTYRQIPADQYQETLLNALSAGSGPDAYMIGDHALPREKLRIVPEDPAVLSPAALGGVFPEAVSQDFVSDGKVWGLPLYFDTLALIANRDLLNQAAIVYPPATWADFQADVNRLKIIDPATNQIKRAGAAIGGTAASVSDAPDIVQNLMLQNGAMMTDATFSSAKFELGGGVEALDFYLQFGNAASPYYTWNDGQSASRAAFSAGNVAMILDYQSAVSAIKDKSPFLNFQVTAFPQISTGTSVTFPNYQGFVVSKQSRASAWAWDFISYVTMTPQAAGSYSGVSGRPPALLSLINAKLDDPDLGVFARQALVARSWYEADDVKINGLFNDAILGVTEGQFDSAKALKIASDQTTVLMQAQGQSQ
jgi:ABC-type glycerol-3-phosphate transport system substrate-binding protein